MRKATNPNIKKAGFIGSNMSNTSPNHEKTRANTIHFFNGEMKVVVLRIK